MRLKRLFVIDSYRPLALIIVFALTVAGARSLWWVYQLSVRAYFDIGCLFWACALILGLIIGTLAVLSWIIWETRSLTPVIFLFICLYLALHAPLPSTPDTPEKAYFAQYRADYEMVIQLAKNDELTLGIGGCGRTLYEIPESMKHLSGNGCLRIYTYSETGLNVFFYSQDGEPFFIGYTEVDNAEYPCGENRDYFFRQRLDVHWTVCRYHEDRN